MVRAIVPSTKPPSEVDVRAFCALLGGIHGVIAYAEFTRLALEPLNRSLETSAWMDASILAACVWGAFVSFLSPKWRYRLGPLALVPIVGWLTIVAFPHIWDSVAQLLMRII